MKEAARKNMELLFDIYEKNCVFPKWSINKFLNEYDKLGKMVKVYYNESDDINVVKKLVTEREPVNIGMVRYYDQNNMQKHFNYSVGSYGKFTENYTIFPPNISIYNYTYVKDISEEFKRIHVIHSIGYAFDDVEQPDYKILMNIKHDIRDRVMIDKYKLIFLKIFQCAVDNNLTTIVMSLVGASNFCILYTEDDNRIKYFRDNIWKSAWEESMEDYETLLKNIDNIKFMGTQKWSDSNLDREDIGYFPDNIKKIDPDKTLFVNAWDPWSLPGNGNCSDNSLDGYVGRCTMSAVLSWPHTNTYLNCDEAYIMVKN